MGETGEEGVEDVESVEEGAGVKAGREERAGEDVM